MENLTPSSSPSPLGANLLERFNTWLQESVMIKLLSIGFLILILLIPASWIQDLMYERQSRANQVINEISQNWSGSQTVSGPILVIPYIRQNIIDRGKDGVEIREVKEKAYFLPAELDITGTLSAEVLHRGIFDAAVYKSKLNLKSTFGKPDFTKFNVKPEHIRWKEAYLAYGLSDHKGVSENPVITVGTDTIVAEPSSNIGVIVKTTPPSVNTDETYVAHVQETESSNGITAQLNWADENAFFGDINMQMDLKGSRRLDFVPAGKTTTVKLNGDWQHPRFDGNFSPEDRTVNDQGFDAKWKVLHFNRPFSQQWNTESEVLSGGDFGITLLMPVDQYLKSVRTAKYSILIILLTFTALFLVEITRKIRIHPFQYILIGAALTIYYTLLLSISEYAGYNIAYTIASLATVLLVTAYARTIMENTRLAMIFGALLAGFYSFIFVIILQQDFSLLIGSIGLFIIIGVLMFVTRKIRWY